MGEARNPGPPLSVAILNPTAMLNKTEAILKLPAQVMFCSETSVTVAASKILDKEFKKHKAKAFWSQFASPKIQTHDGRPSLRGDAVGCAIVSQVHSRTVRYKFPEVLWETCRICAAIIRCEGFEALMISIYGFVHNGLHDLKRLNDIILAHVVELISFVNLPFIIGGDFNIDVQTLPSFQLLRQMGAVEAFSFFQNKFGIQLPPTCRGATRNDTCVLHPIFAQSVVNMHVVSEPLFEPHSPLIVDFDIQTYSEHLNTWKVPRSWACLGVQPQHLEAFYIKHSRGVELAIGDITSVESGAEVLAQWSSAVEKSVDSSLRLQHSENPTINPLPNLPPSYRGRCCKQMPSSNAGRKTPKSDLHGGYNPPCEVFKLTNHHKIRQARRIKSLIRAVQSSLSIDSSNHPFPPISHLPQLRNEWQAILKARGYGKAWAHWILAFDLVTCLPTFFPTLDELSMFSQLTELDCTASCNQEKLAKKKSFKHLIQVDNDQNFGSITYRIIKNKNTPKLEEVPFRVFASAALLRKIRDAPLQVKIDQDIQFMQHQPAKFGDATVMIDQQCQRVITIRLISGKLPARAELSQMRVTTCASEVFQEFYKFWSPMWQRDSYQSQFSDDDWASFHDEIQNVPIPHMQIDINLEDPEIWMRTINKLKPGKAEGICGWRHEELQALPAVAIKHLAKIFAALWSFGMPSHLMQGRTVLLAKNSEPKSMHDGRPITILSVLYRLASKIVFDQVIQTWMIFLPNAISGGIPGRGARDHALNQILQVEKAIIGKSGLCGSCIDLVKAFNLIPRRPTAIILNNLGIPQNILAFWTNSLARMRRVPQAFDCIGHCMESTTGLPEGDSWSVLGMLGISTFWYFKLLNPCLKPHSYADNWSWLTKNQKQNILAWQKTLNFVSSLRMVVDTNKSWVWATTKDLKNSSSDISLLSPSGQTSIPIKNVVKDLGEIVQYSLQQWVQPIADKIQETVQRVKRLSWIPCTLQQKAQQIQNGCWTFGLYGADLHFVGLQHFTKLRRAATSALAGNHKSASSWLTGTIISKNLDDPLLFVVLSAIRVLRRLAFHSPDQAREFVELAISAVVPFPCGPATTFQKYMRILGWKIALNGDLTHISGLTVNCLHSCIKELVLKFRLGWTVFVQEQIEHRRGIPSTPFDAMSTKRIFQALSDTDQKAIILNMLGGWQSQIVQSKWNAETSGACPLCGQEDDQKHRFVECPELSHIRQLHPDAVAILAHHKKDWRYHPITCLPTDYEHVQQCITTTTFNPDLPDLNLGGQSVRFFTDGACENPTNPFFRRSAWAIILDLSKSAEHRSAILQQSASQMEFKNLFQCLGTGLTTGKQSIDRAELTAVVTACRWSVHVARCRATLFTDSQYVINVVNKIRKFGPVVPLHKMANPDLVQELAQLWKDELFAIFKVKSHRQFNDAKDYEDLWAIYGNSLADTAAGQALVRIPDLCKEWIEDSKTRHMNEQEALKITLSYIAQLNLERQKLLKSKNSTTEYVRGGQATGDDAWAILHDVYRVPTTCMTQDALPIERAQANLQGTNFAFRLWAWLQTLEWPDHSVHSQEPFAWGISWLELLLNFLVITGTMPPIRVSGQGSKSIYVSYFSVEAEALPPRKKHASVMCLIFVNALQTLKNISGKDILPTFDTSGCSSLRRLGYQTNAQGLKIRPILQRNAATLLELKRFLNLANPKNVMSTQIQKPLNPPSLQIDDVAEDSARQRFANYMRLQKRNARGA